jgi:hypothetical protein
VREGGKGWGGGGAVAADLQPANALGGVLQERWVVVAYVPTRLCPGLITLQPHWHRGIGWLECPVSCPLRLNLPLLPLQGTRPSSDAVGSWLAAPGHAILLRCGQSVVLWSTESCCGGKMDQPGRSAASCMVPWCHPGMHPGPALGVTSHTLGVQTRPLCAICRRPHRHPPQRLSTHACLQFEN